MPTEYSIDAGPPIETDIVYTYGTTVLAYCPNCREPKRPKKRRRQNGLVLYRGAPDLAEVRAVEHLLEECRANPRDARVELKRILYRPGGG